jgi:hypothetical protein
VYARLTRLRLAAFDEASAELGIGPGPHPPMGLQFGLNPRRR